MKITLEKLPKNKAVNFEYQFFSTPIGKLLIASWEKNLVSISFASNQKKALSEVKKHYPRASFQKKKTSIQEQVLEYIRNPKKFKKRISVATNGTSFQQAVWKLLARIPFGKTLFYGEIAKALKKPNAVRAVASAVAKNPLAILIPCHRVLPRSGGIGKYHWGTKNKNALLMWEKRISTKK